MPAHGCLSCSKCHGCTLCSTCTCTVTINPGLGGAALNTADGGTWVTSMFAPAKPPPEREMLHEILADASIRCAHDEGEECALCQARAKLAAEALAPAAPAPTVGGHALAMMGALAIGAAAGSYLGAKAKPTSIFAKLSAWKRPKPKTSAPRPHKKRPARAK